MSYGTPAGFKGAVGSDRLMLALGNPSDPTLQAMLDAASGEIDSHLAPWYVVPVDPVLYPEAQAMLATWAYTIAFYRALSLGAKGAPRELRLTMEQLFSELARVRAGMAAIPYVTPLSRRRIAVIGDAEKVLTSTLWNTARRIS